MVAGIAVASLVASPFIGVVVNKLGATLFEEWGLCRSVRSDARRLQSVLETILNVLDDAEQQPITNKALRGWLTKLKDAALDADDVVDDLLTEALRRRAQDRSRICRTVRDFLSSKNPMLLRHKMVHRIKDARARLDEIADERNRFHLTEGSVSHGRNERETCSAVVESEVYGRDNDKEKVINFLLEVDNEKDLSILPIVGLGGIGKTTLAQLVYNDERTLNLQDCYHLQKLPASMRHMINLRHLDISGCSGLIHMPLSIGQLSNLQTLPMFIVGMEDGCRINELDQLNLIRGRLKIKNLNNVNDPMEALKANLFRKTSLQSLKLSWKVKFNGRAASLLADDVLEKLEPCSNLRVLTMKTFPGIRFPGWLTNHTEPSSSFFPYLVKIKLEDFEKCECLPPLGLLPSLKELSLIKLTGVKRIGIELYGNGGTFPSLVQLEISDMPDMEKWSTSPTNETTDARMLFPCLKMLVARGCPKLEVEPCFPPSVESLVIEDCENLLSARSLQGLSKLQSLDFGGNVALPSAFDGLQNLTALELLRIESCDELTCMPESLMQHHIPSFQSLKLINNSNLKSLGEGRDQQPPSLFTSLCHLEIEASHSLTALPEWIRYLPLQILKIRGCSQLEGRCQRETDIQTLSLDDNPSKCLNNASRTHWSTTVGTIGWDPPRVFGLNNRNRSSENQGCHSEYPLNGQDQSIHPHAKRKRAVVSTLNAIPPPELSRPPPAKGEGERVGVVQGVPASYFLFDNKGCDFTLGKFNRARAARLTLPHFICQTPLFMPVGTQGTIKGLTNNQLEEIGCQIILGNTYHLALRPGAELIDDLGGLHKFMNWKRALLTDSGGFQMVSLLHLADITEQGVTFQSPVDGKPMLLTPEESIQIQNKIGADIIMALDDVVKTTITGPRIEEAMYRTLRWIDRCIAAHKRPDAQNLFGIVQGGLDPVLSYAIGGLAGGEDKDSFWRVVAQCTAALPEDKPRYVMGVGYPLDIVVCSALGADMYDCVYPTRTARFGTALVPEGVLRLKNQAMANDERPIDSTCTCMVCRNYTRAYLHCLVTKAAMGSQLVSYHNLSYMMRLSKDLHTSIVEGQFPEFVQRFLRAQFPKGNVPQWVCNAMEVAGVDISTCCAPITS
ncbi:hypothetical protein MUK42_11588 [Musa troglodytarum]|uniref:Queuine tRNA-ribosyltransferase catalytic subunit 1 n=1 Tax=Musa troglodytarum TaxID=320322 RepID=A0A9E7GIP8_9LILI|nr:hypothetical protein MUK42_11588 [Musa troglodytarum]